MNPRFWLIVCCLTLFTFVEPRHIRRQRPFYAQTENESGIQRVRPDSLNFDEHSVSVTHVHGKPGFGNRSLLNLTGETLYIGRWMLPVSNLLFSHSPPSFFLNNVPFTGQDFQRLQGMIRRADDTFGLNLVLSVEESWRNPKLVEELHELGIRVEVQFVYVRRGIPYVVL